MKYLLIKLHLLLSAALFASMATSLVYADDTEVYLGGNPNTATVRPNVLFIIDTSGSMGSSVTLTNGTYDPNGTYTGNCSTTRLYWSTTGSPPSCFTSQYISTTANKCNDSSSALASAGSGFYVGKLARYRNRSSDYWTSLSHHDHTSNVECQADYGVHGDGANATKLYPANQNKGGPWTSTQSNSINWGSTGRNYTLYSAKYLNWFWGAGNTTTTTRLQIVKDTFSSLLNSTAGINAGLMRFSSNGEGGYFLQPMLNLTPANRTTLIANVNALSPGGVTPLSESLYESSLYWRGLSVDYGDNSSPGVNTPAVLDPANTAKYKSPMEFQCQKNFTVLLTDGQPVSDTSANSKIANLPGFAATTGAASCSGNCLDEVAQWTYENDLIGNINNKQNVLTYTIGFLTDQALLSSTASKGGGTYYTAESANELSSAFTSILTEILSVNSTFIAPAVTVNAFNRLSHRDALYFAVFRPLGSPDWPGNIKHYKLKGNPAIVVDANDAPAVDANTGFFSSTSTSYWTLPSDAPDGEQVDIGGAAGLLTLTRNMYTYTDAAAPANANLTDARHRLTETNTALTKTMLGIATESDAYRTSLVQWARGVDVLDDDEDNDTTDARRALGDSLHTKPVLMTYGGTDLAPDITLFTGTNEGFIHALDSATGMEQFAFIPQELLVNLDIRYKNSSTTPHPYGMDGPLSLWHNDDNLNGVLLNAAGAIETNEHVYLYAGMRRGGSTYYALDVSNRTTPRLLWKIVGGAGNFMELGQTWSRPIVTKIKFNAGAGPQERNVLIFGGGYDTDQDTAPLPTADDIGRAIYIVDASTGQRLWWGSVDATADEVFPSMTNSIPSDITVLDMDVDGYADRMYVGDMGGRVWRFDINNTSNNGATDLVTGGVLATVNAQSSVGNRRFYYQPDIALVTDNGSKVLTISIGSGYRAHPLNTTIEDRFYMIRDVDVYTPPADANGDGIPDYTNYTEANLYDTTANDLIETSGTTLATAQSAFAAAKGWYLKLADSAGVAEGEKVLARSVTVEDKVIFTSFTPVALNQANSCAPSQGTAKLYVLNLLNGTPAIDFNTTDQTTYGIGDRSTMLSRGGIAPEPSILFPPGASPPIVLVGPEKVNVDLKMGTEKSYWKQEE